MECVDREIHRRGNTMNERAYLESGGSICLDCGSSNISGGQMDFDSETREVECNDCGSVWLDIYKLVGVMEKP